MPNSRADVVTDAPARYAKQLLSHLGHKAAGGVEQVDDAPDGGRLVFAYGTATLRPGDGLLIEAAAPDEEGLAHVEDVIRRHLERFGARAELRVTWQRD